MGRHSRHTRRTTTLTLSGLLLLAITNTVLAQFGGPPPADVPDAVVMERPTQEQLNTLDDALSDFTTSLEGEAKAILDSFPYLLEVTPRGRNTAIIPSLSPAFQAKHEANKAVAAAGDIDVLFMGDSITDFWRNETGAFAGKAVFDEYFGHWNVANFGIAGDTTQGVLYRLQNGEGEGFSPKAVMLLIGVNNTRTHIAGEIAEGVGAVVLELKDRFPSAKILLLGVFPYQPPGSPTRNAINEINATISRLHDGETVHYLDIGHVFLDEEGRVPEEVMSDGLHPGPEGYRRWAEAVIEPLTKLVEG